MKITSDNTQITFSITVDLTIYLMTATWPVLAGPSLADPLSPAIGCMCRSKQVAHMRLDFLVVSEGQSNFVDLICQLLSLHKIQIYPILYIIISYPFSGWFFWHWHALANLMPNKTSKKASKHRKGMIRYDIVPLAFVIII